MALPPGLRLGPFEIVSALGAGGMGEVYRARDTRLDRDVAIKILPEAFAADAARLARFEREAKTLASLNHPHIAQLHGLEESGQVRALVMELVEGADLSWRLRRGAIPLDEALPIARQIADALEAAHDQGIVHRDLKPGNIKVRGDGTVKILDFGLAKAMDRSGAGPDHPQGSDGPPPETITATAITMQGAIVGTAAYMSPEQAAGKPVDKRSDLWSFGVVLFEMLSGLRLFTGDSTSEVLVSVLTHEPDWSALPADTPLLVQRLLRRCLEKDRRRRQADAADVRLEIEEAIAERRSSRPLAALRSRRWVTAAGLGALLVLVIIAGVWIAPQLARPASPPAVSRSLIDFPQTPMSGGRMGNLFAVSRDGARLVYVGNPDGVNRLYFQRLDQFEATVIPGTEDGGQPFFAPDGNWVAFFADGKLKKVSMSGGPPQTLADAYNPYGGAWAADGTIVFSPDGRGLMKTSASGHAPERITEREKGSFAHSWPAFLPGETEVAFTSVFSGSASAIEAVSLKTRATRRLVDQGCCAAFTSSGHFLYSHTTSGSIHAAPFDRDRRQIAGEPVTVLQGVMSSAANGNQFFVSDTGSVLYLMNRPVTERGLVWVDRAGRNTPLDFPRRTYGTPAISPDGRHVVMNVYEGLLPVEIWSGDLERGTLSRLVSGGRSNSAPIWTPDGSRVTFQSTRDGQRQNLYWVRADGSGAIERLTTSDYPQVPTDWTPDGKTLVFYHVDPPTGYDILTVDLAHGHVVKPLIVTPFNEHTSKLSPNGRFIAFISNRTGRFEVYVQPFPGPGDVRQLSTNGGTEPVWSRDGHELFFRQGDKMMVADVSITADFSAARPRPLFEGRYEVSFVVPGARFYDVSPDGQRFLMLKSDAATAPRQLHLIVNWFEELKRLVPLR